jgi:hypothetical protein
MANNIGQINSRSNFAGSHALAGSSNSHSGSKLNSAKNSARSLHSNSNSNIIDDVQNADDWASSVAAAVTESEVNSQPDEQHPSSDDSVQANPDLSTGSAQIDEVSAGSIISDTVVAQNAESAASTVPSNEDDGGLDSL